MNSPRKRKENASSKDVGMGGILPIADIDNEECLLSCLINSRDALLDCNTIKPEMFYYEINRSIYEVILAIDGQNMAVDMMLIVTQSKKMGIEIDPYQLTMIATKVVQYYNALNYAFKLKEDWLRRALVEVSLRIRQIANDLTIDVDDVLSETNTLIEEVISSSTANVSINSPAELVTEVYTDYEERHAAAAKNEIIGGVTGIRGLDKILSGCQGGRFYVIAARPGTGKTELALKIARETSTRSMSVLIFSLEMGKNELTQRLVLSYSNISAERFRAGTMTDSEIVEMLRSREKINNLSINISDDVPASPRQIRSISKRMMREGKCDMIIVDYLQLMEYPIYANNREQEVSAISRSLKNLSRELNVPVIALSQLNRKCEDRSDKRPLLSDLRESGAIEQDADAVIFMYRPELYYDPGDNDNGVVVEKGRGEIDVKKNRSGKTAYTYFYYNEEFNKLYSSSSERDYDTNPPSYPDSHIEPNTPPF